MDPNRDEDTGLVCRSFAFTARSVNMTARTVDVVMSTDMIDRFGERVEQDWDLKSFAANPVVLWAHSSRELPIGRAERVRVAQGALQGTIHFASAAANPLAEQCLQLFNEGVLNAVSVGFIPHTSRFETEDDKEVLVLSKNELVELSVTPTPANPEALAKMRARALRPTPQQQSLPIEGANQEKSDMDLEQKIKDLESSAAKSADAIATTTKALETSNAQTADLKSKLDASEKSLTEATAKLTEATAKVDAESKRAKAAEEAVTTAKVDALVGKKITPAERDEFVELALSNHALYEKMIAKRADMPMATGALVVAAEKGIPAPPTSAGLGDDALASLIDKQNNFAPLESYGAEDVIQDN